MNNQKHWYKIENGATINTQGSEGTIVKDDEYSLGARITLERDGMAPWSITLGDYGNFFHTAFFSEEAIANKAFDDIKIWIEKIIDLHEVNEDQYFDEIEKLVSKY